MMTIQWQQSNGTWLDVSLAHALTPQYENQNLTNVIGSILGTLVQKELLTFEEALEIIEESPDRYRGY